MSSNAFSNANIKDKLCGGCDCTGFVAGVGFEYDAEAKTIAFTDTTVYSTGDYRKIVHLEVRDDFGGKVKGQIASDDGDNAVTIDIATLNVAGGIHVLATVVSQNGCLSDGHAEWIGISVTVGNLGYWDKDNDALTVGAVDSGS